MSETQRHLFNRQRTRLRSRMPPARSCVSDLWMAGAFVLLLIVVVVRFLSSAPVRHAPEPVKSDTFQVSPRRVQQPPPVFDVSEAYYSTIIDNNLFRPLGWTPPRPVEPYRLLGTRLPTDKSTPPQAILQSTATNKTYIVTPGDKLDAATEVVEIQAKQILLKIAGQQKTLRLKSRFLQRR